MATVEAESGVTGVEAMHAETAAHQEAAAAVVQFATEADASNTEPAATVDNSAHVQPSRMTDWRAVEGLHPTWLGFDRSGLPKNG